MKKTIRTIILLFINLCLIVSIAIINRACGNVKDENVITASANTPVIVTPPTSSLLLPIIASETMEQNRETTSAETAPQQITDLTGTTWEFYATQLAFDGEGERYDINFSDENENNYISIIFYNAQLRIEYVTTNNTIIRALNFALWTNEAYRTITIAGGTDATNPALIAEFENNATLISGGEEPGNPYEIAQGSYYINFETMETMPTNGYGSFSFAFFRETAPGGTPVYHSFFSYDSAGNAKEYDGIEILYNNGAYAINYLSTIDSISDNVYNFNYYQGIQNGWRSDLSRYIYIQEPYIFTPISYIPDPGFEQLTIDVFLWFKSGLTLQEPLEEEVIWYQQGYLQGLADARRESNVGLGIWNGLFSFISMFFGAITAFLTVQIVPGLSLGLIVIGIPLAFWAISLIFTIIRNVFTRGGS